MDVFGLLTLCAGIFVLIFAESIFFTAIAWAYHHYAEPTEFGPLNFDRADQESFRKYAPLVIMLTGIPSVLLHVAGYFFQQWWMARSGYWIAFIVLSALQFGFLAFMIPIQFNNIDQKKATILAAANTAVYMLLYLMVMGKLLR